MNESFGRKMVKANSLRLTTATVQESHQVVVHLLVAAVDRRVISSPGAVFDREAAG